MSGEGAMGEYSGDSVRSPLKSHATKTSNPGESVHTFAEDAGDCQSKPRVRMRRPMTNALRN